VASLAEADSRSRPPFKSNRPRLPLHNEIVANIPNVRTVEFEAVIKAPPNIPAPTELDSEQAPAQGRRKEAWAAEAGQMGLLAQHFCKTREHLISKMSVFKRSNI
jgi:hypothetical protein